MMVAEIERRAGARKRTRVLKRAILLAPGGAQAVRLKDVSCAGARVEIHDAVQPDWDVILQRGSVFVAARVVWARDDHAGILFYRPLAEGESVLLLRPATRPDRALSDQRGSC